MATKVMSFVRRNAQKLGAGAGVAVVSVAALSGVAGAAQPTVEETFSTTQTSVLTEFGYGAALVIAVLLFVIGIRIVVNWSNKASKQKA